MDLIKRYFSSLNINDNLIKLNHIETLITKHLAEFYFTSIPVLLKRELSLELPQIFEKIVERREGGYCFEHNKLMYEALLYSGFSVKSFFGRVLNNRDIIVPKTHRFTVLTYEDEDYLIDVGFGFMSPSMPIKFGAIPTTTHLGVSYIIKEYENGIFALQTILENDFYTLYKFDLNSCNEIDFEVSHFYSHKHPNANFVNNFVLSCILEEEIRSLRNSNYQKIFMNHKEEITIDTQEQLQKILELEFNYHIEFNELQYIYDNFVSIN